MHIISRLLLVVLVLTTCFLKAEKRSTQRFFPVESESGRVFDSLYKVYTARDFETIEDHIKWAHRSPLNSVADSMGYYLSVGVSYRLLEKYDSGAMYLSQGRILGHRHKDDVYLGAILNSLGNLHYFIQDEDKALEMYIEATTLDISERTLLAMHHNIGVILQSRYEKSTNPIYKDSIEPIINSSFRSCLKLEKQTNDFVNMAGTYSVLIPWYAERGMFDSAYHFGEKCYQLCIEHDLNDRKAFMGINVGRAMILQKRYEEAFDTIQFGVNHFKRINDLEQTISAMMVQTRALDSMKRYDESRAVLQEMFQLERSKAKEKLADAISDYENRFETQKQLLINSRLSQQTEQDRYRLNTSFLIIGLLLAISLGITMFYRNRIKKREVLLQQQKINHQNELIRVNMESEERERKRIARELHDGVGQQIAGIKMSLNNLQELKQTTQDAVVQLKSLVEETLNSVRGLSHQMMPLALQRFGLQKALMQLVDFQNENSSTNYKFESIGHDSFNLSEDQEIHLYRMVQELFNNIEKHAQASQAQLQCVKGPDFFLLTISDNGSGIPEEVGDGIGLSNVRTRAEAIGAMIHFDSRPGETVVTVKLPMM